MQALFDEVMGKPWRQEEIDQLSKKEEKAWGLLKRTDYTSLRTDTSLRTEFVHVVMYVAFEFHIREVYSTVLEIENSYYLRPEDVRTLISQKHIKEIKKTLNKAVISSTILEMFLESHLSSKLKLSNYRVYSLSFYVEHLLLLEKGSDEIRYFCFNFMDFFNPNKLIKIFIKYDRIDLVQWAQSHSSYHFKDSQVAIAIQFNAFDIAQYFLQHNHNKLVKAQFSQKMALISSFQNNSELYDVKLYYLKMFYKHFTGMEFVALLKIFKSKLLREDYQENPFLFCLNPVRTALLMVEILREIRRKFQILRVRCLELEEYLEESVYRFLGMVTSEEIASFMLLEKDFENRDSLDLLSKFEFYRILQQSRVEEVIMKIYVSKYEVDTRKSVSPLSQKLMLNEKICNKYDIEAKHRFVWPKFDWQEIPQNSFMFYISRESITQRYFYYLGSLTFFTLVFIGLSLKLISLFTEDKLYQPKYAFMDKFKNLEDIPDETLQILNSTCYHFIDYIDPYYYTIKIMTNLAMLEFSLGAQLICDFVFNYKTGRNRNFFTLENLVIILLNGCQYYFAVLNFKKGSMDLDSEGLFCNELIGLTDNQIWKRKYVLNYVENTSLTNLILACDIVLLLLLILLKLKMTVWLGPMINIIINITLDFLKIAMFFYVLLEVYSQIGYAVFSDLEDFGTSAQVTQTLFMCVQGTFNFSIYDQEDPFNLNPWRPIVGRIYIITWLIISTIIFLNLLIAIFNNTYTKLNKERVGHFLREIIFIRPQYEYEEYYSSLMLVAYPLNTLLLLFLPFFLFIKSKRFNFCVQMFFYVLTYFVLESPVMVFFCCVRMLKLYGKSLANKVYLLTLKSSQVGGRSYGDRLAALLGFLLWGWVYFAAVVVIDFFMVLKLRMKPEKELNLRYHKEPEYQEKNLSVLCIKQLMHGKWKAKEFFFTKQYIADTRDYMEIDKAILDLMDQSSSTHESSRELIRTFKRIKKTLVESSIKLNDQLILFPSMFIAIIEDIHFQNRYQAVREVQQQQLSWFRRSTPANKVEPAANNNNNASQDLSASESFGRVSRRKAVPTSQEELDGKARKVWQHLLMSQVGIAAQAFVRNQTSHLDQQIQKAVSERHELYKKSIMQFKRELQYKF